MATISLEELYDRYIKPLAPAERMQLMAMTAQDLAQVTEQSTLKPKRSLIAAAIGAGCEAFLTNDAQLQRVAELRVLAWMIWSCKTYRRTQKREIQR